MLSEQEVVEMRQRLSQAALDLFAAEGYEAVSLRELAHKLGISHTLPYRYFENKEALFAQVRADCFRRFREMLIAHDPVTQPAVVRLRTLGYAILAFVKARPAEYRLMFCLNQPPLERYPDLLAARREAFNYLLGVVQHGVDQGEIQGDARTVLHIAWVSLHGLFTLHAAGQLVHGRNLEALIEPLIAAVIGRQSSDSQPQARTRRAARIRS